VKTDAGKSSVVWDGAEQLRGSLVRLDSLEPFPGNPRRSDVGEIRASLRRFGQVRPILVDGKRIVAGHHVVEAARQEGWTHAAATANEFGSEDEARAYLLADNRIPELAAYDDELLAAQLAALAEAEIPLEGTGWGEDALANLRRLAEASPLTGDGTPRERRDPNVKEVVLLYSSDQLRDFENWAAVVGRETGVAGVSGVVFEALRRAAASF